MDVKSRFVEQVLQEEGVLMNRYQEAAIRKRTTSRSGNLLGHRAMTVSASTGASGALTLRHVDYERFLDMKRLHRGSKTYRSNRKIHNRFVFGTYGHIAKRLMTEFTDEVAAKLKGTINAG